MVKKKKKKKKKTVAVRKTIWHFSLSMIHFYLGKFHMSWVDRTVDLFWNMLPVVERILNLD